jgi:hypothetical protein
MDLAATAVAGRFRLFLLARREVIELARRLLRCEQPHWHEADIEQRLPNSRL